MEFLIKLSRCVYRYPFLSSCSSDDVRHIKDTALPSTGEGELAGDRLQQMEFYFTKVNGVVKATMVALSTFFIFLEYYFDLQCITIFFQCCNLLATSMFNTFQKVL